MSFHKTIGPWVAVTAWVCMTCLVILAFIRPQEPEAAAARQTLPAVRAKEGAAKAEPRESRGTECGNARFGPPSEQDERNDWLEWLRRRLDRERAMLRLHRREVERLEQLLKEEENQ